MFVCMFEYKVGPGMQNSKPHSLKIVRITDKSSCTKHQHSMQLALTSRLQMVVVKQLIPPRPCVFPLRNRCVMDALCRQPLLD